MTAVDIWRSTAADRLVFFGIMTRCSLSLYLSVSLTGSCFLPVFLFRSLSLLFPRSVSHTRTLSFFFFENEAVRCMRVRFFNAVQPFSSAIIMKHTRVEDALSFATPQ